MADLSRDNDSKITFTTPTGDWGTVSYFGIFNHSSNTGSTAFLLKGQINPSRDVQSGDSVFFDAGQLTLTIADPAGSSNLFSNLSKGKMLDSIVASGSAVYLSLHSGDPGDTGANELSGNGYLRQSVASGAWS